MLDYDLQKEITEPLLEWFEHNARVLPWRNDPQAYRVWVSEIMLQQTRVEAVKPYFERFMNELPTIADLAVCPEEKLLKLWEGLGYYNRVRNMKLAAIDIVEHFHGELPRDEKQLLSLKGIGSYTAGAIASIAYQMPIPAVDGNVLRVITRLCADRSDIAKPAVKKKIEDDLRIIMPKDHAGSFNQALMELGATVCLPNGAPLCDKCPWNQICQARKQDLIDQIPVKTKAKARKIEDKTVLIIRDNNRIAIRKRPNKGLLAGLYELPNLEGFLDEQQVLTFIRQLKLPPVRIIRVEDSKHIFTHKEWHMRGFVIQLADDDVAPEELTTANSDFKSTDKSDDKDHNPLIFVSQSQMDERYAIPTAFQAYLPYITKKAYYE